MKQGRFGNITILVWLGIVFLLFGAIAVFVSDAFWSLILGVLVFFVVVMFIDPWLYPIRKQSYDYRPDLKYIDIYNGSTTVFMNRFGRTIGFEICKKPTPNLYAYDNNPSGWEGRNCDGVKVKLYNTLAGDFTIIKTPKGYRVSWSDEEPWLMGISK